MVAQISTVELYLSVLSGMANYPYKQNIQVIELFFVYRLHWQLEVRLLLFTLCTCV